MPTRREAAGLGAVALILCAVVFLACAGLTFLVEIPGTLAFGWVRYLGRVGPKLDPDPAAVATAVACLTGVLVGGHLFLRWLYAATSPQPESAGPRRWPWKWSFLLVGLVVLMFAAGIAVTGIAHQTGWLLRSPEPLTHDRYGGRDRTRSNYNLKMIGFAVHTHQDGSGRLPRSTFDATGRPLHSWLTELLPYVEQGPLCQRIDPTKPWTDPVNRPATSTRLPVFLNPSHPTDSVNGFGASHYAGNVRVVLTDKPLRLTAFPGGTANVVLAGEVTTNVRAWGDPLNARDPRLGANAHPDGFGGPNRPPQFVMLDGSVRTFDPKELADLAAGTVPK